MSPEITGHEGWCFECGKKVFEHPGWFPIQSMFEMHMHYESEPHHRWRVEKSRQSGRWLVKYGDLIVRTTHTQPQAMFIAFERHPWTRHERFQKREFT